MLQFCKVLKNARGDGGGGSDQQHWLCNHSPDEMRSSLSSALGKEEAAKQFVVDLTDYPRVCIVCRQGSCWEED